MRWFRDIGPGVLIAAAFIGPGTVTLCTIAGASFGYSLIWAIILSIFSTIVLQEMSLRIGLITKMNLAQVISLGLSQLLVLLCLPLPMELHHLLLLQKLYLQFHLLLIQNECLHHVLVWCEGIISGCPNLDYIITYHAFITINLCTD